jgi:hypothetical protein
MAPSTAWSMLLLSLSVFAHDRWPTRPLGRGFTRLGLISVTAMGLLAGAQWLGGFELPVEGWLTSATDRTGDVPVGRMSPLTASMSLLAALALVLEMPPWDRRWWCRQTASVLALVTLWTSAVVALSYAASVP